MRRVIAGIVVVSFVAVSFAAPEASSTEPATPAAGGPLRILAGASSMGDGALLSDAERTILDATPASPVPPVEIEGASDFLFDKPGGPFGWPDDNTYGYTTDGPDLDKFFWDHDSSPVIEVDVGKHARKDKMAKEKEYLLAIGFSVFGYFWIDGDGKFDPVTGEHDGTGDDPCEKEPFRIFTVWVNDQKIRTVEGHKMKPCAVGGPETDGGFRWFEIKAVGNDPAHIFRVPKSIVHHGKNSLRIEVHDHREAFPAVSGSHSAYSDGWLVDVSSVMLEIAAPPLIISHGWTPEFSPAFREVVPWQPTLRAQIRLEAQRHLGQDPWAWANDDGGAVILNTYDRKGDVRQSAEELRQTANALFDRLGYSGKGWIHGHSMGGLVTRWYVELKGGASKFDKVAQTGTPNAGAPTAHLYTYGYWMLYEALDNEYTAKLLCQWPLFRDPGEPCTFGVWRGWRDWWSSAIGAYHWLDGPSRGRSHIADFQLKPEGSNPHLQILNAHFGLGGAKYFSVRAVCLVSKKPCLLAGTPIGDSVVSLGSATLGGRIPSRTINEFHEDIPLRIEAARWFARFFLDLDLDSGKPESGGGGGGSWDFAGPSALDVLPAFGDDGLPPTASEVALLSVRAEDLADGPFEHDVRVDASARAVLRVMARPEEPPIRVEVRAPSGAVYGVDPPEGSGVTFVEDVGTGLTTYAFIVDAPDAGTWTLLIDPEEAPPVEGLPLLVLAESDSPVTLRASAAQPRYRPGETAVVLAKLAAGDAPVTGASVVARTADDAIVLDLADDGAHGDGAAGDGVYGAFLGLPEEDDALSFRVTAEGSTSGASFVRATLVDVLVARFVDVAAVGVAGAPAGAWGGDEVDLTATILAGGERETRGNVLVEFHDGDPAAGGRLLGTVTVQGPIPAGETRTATLRTVAPAHALAAFVRAIASDVDRDATNDETSAAMPFVPTPRTAAAITGSVGASGWLLGPASVALAPFDGSPAAYARTTFQIDDGPTSTYAGPFTVAAEGDHALRWRSVDAAGNVERDREARVKVDLAPPEARLVAPAPGDVRVGVASIRNPLGFALVVGLVDVTVDASDSGAGVARVTAFIDGEHVGDLALADDGRYHVLWDAARASIGNHVLSWSADDGAGRSVGGALPVYVLAGRTIEIDRRTDATVDRVTPPGVGA